jgi:hypothetical protein
MSDIEINIAKAKAEAAEAEERVKGSIWERMTKDTVRFSEAAQLYSRAGNFYRLAKQRAFLDFRSLRSVFQLLRQRIMFSIV